MPRLRLAFACALGALALAPQAAAGGGWWTNIHLNRSVVAPGERVEISEAVYFRSTTAAEEAQQTGFYVYLLRGFDYSVVERALGEPSPRNWWSLGGAEAIQVAPVAVTVSDSNIGRASAEFTVPELAPDTYHLMLCGAGCTEPLADVIPAGGVSVVADPATARMAERVDNLERVIRKQARELNAARADADSAADRALVAARESGSAAEQLGAAKSSVADEGRTSPWGYAGWLVAGLLAGGLLVLVVSRRRSRPSGPAEWHPSDEELLELLSDPRPPASRSGANT